MGHSAGAGNAAMLSIDPRWLALHGLSQRDIAATVALAAPLSFNPLTAASVKDIFAPAADDPDAARPVKAGGRGARPPPRPSCSHGTGDRTIGAQNASNMANAVKRGERPGGDPAPTTGWGIWGCDEFRMAAALARALALMTPLFSWLLRPARRRRLSHARETAREDAVRTARFACPSGRHRPRRPRAAAARAAARRRRSQRGRSAERHGPRPLPRLFQAPTKSDETQAPLPAGGSNGRRSPTPISRRNRRRASRGAGRRRAGDRLGLLHLRSGLRRSEDRLGRDGDDRFGKATGEDRHPSNFGTEAATEISLVNGATGWKIADFAFLENSNRRARWTGILKDPGTDRSVTTPRGRSGETALPQAAERRGRPSASVTMPSVRNCWRDRRLRRARREIEIERNARPAVRFEQARDVGVAAGPVALQIDVPAFSKAAARRARTAPPR